jgi:hypothetical protein
MPGLRFRSTNFFGWAKLTHYPAARTVDWRGKLCYGDGLVGVPTEVC